MGRKSKAFLIINPYGIGDVLFSTVLIRNITHAFPDARIYYLGNARTQQIIGHHPLIRTVFVYDRDAFGRLREQSFFQWFGRLVSFIWQIRKERIDVALDLSINTFFGLVSFLAGIPVRVGFDYRRRGFFLTHKVPMQGFEGKHVAEFYLSLLAEINVPVVSREMEVFTSQQNDDWAERVYAEKKIKRDALVIGIAPCGGEAFGKDAYIKRWPEAYYAELINALVEKYQATIFLFAGPKEKEEIGRIMGAIKRPESCFEWTDTSLGQLVSLVKRCTLFIGNDTGPLRFANALKKKSLAFFGPVDEVVYGLFPDVAGLYVHLKTDISCRPCYRKFRLRQCENDLQCLRGIRPHEVMNVVERMLK